MALVFAAAVVAGSFVGARTAWAHSGLAAASPGPGAVVGGEIDVVQLFYGDIILEFDATLTTPSGEILPAEPVMLSEITAELRLEEPLSEPGEYALRHTILSFDDDVVEAAYLFTFEPGADPPILIFIEEDDDDGGGLAWWAWAIIGVGALLIVVLAVRLVLSIRRARAGRSPAKAEPGAADDDLR